MRRRAVRRAAGIAAGLLLLTACAESVRPADEWFPGQQEPPRAASGHRGTTGTPGANEHTKLPRALPGGPRQDVPDDAPAAGEPGILHQWGLDHPLAAPPRPPARRPVQPPDSGLPAVVDRIPVKEPVVFVTIDDGVEKDPDLIRMAADARLPFSMFLADHVASDDYGYFAELQLLGNAVHGHTLTHPDLTRLSYAGQRRQICAQQERIARRFGVRSTVFRPPFGEYDKDTLRAAASCGVRTVALWRAEMKRGGLEYRRGDRLRPGDIVLAHFQGPEQLRGRTMPELLGELVQEIQRQGFTVARLEDYV